MFLQIRSRGLKRNCLLHNGPPASRSNEHTRVAASAYFSAAARIGEVSISMACFAQKTLPHCG